MAQQDIVAFLEKNYPNEKIKYLGQGSDSDAFRVGTRVFRFTSKNISIYAKDADICSFSRTLMSKCLIFKLFIAMVFNMPCMKC